MRVGFESECPFTSRWICPIVHEGNTSKTNCFKREKIIADLGIHCTVRI